jgi:hypothetical protein
MIFFLVILVIMVHTSIRNLAMTAMISILVISVRMLVFMMTVLTTIMMMFIILLA